MLHLLTCKLNIEGTLRLRTYGVLGKVCLEVPGFEPRPSDSQPDIMTQLRDLRHLTENKDPRWWVQSLATHASNFSTPACKKKSTNALSVRVILFCSDHKLPWQDSYKGVGSTSTLPESILHKIFIIMVFFVLHNSKGRA